MNSIDKKAVIKKPIKIPFRNITVKNIESEGFEDSNINLGYYDVYKKKINKMAEVNVYCDSKKGLVYPPFIFKQLGKDSKELYSLEEVNEYIKDIPKYD